MVLFHSGWTWLRGGFVGVDVFFVISGYLITSILLRENTEGSFSLVNFYRRRVRRLIPALCVVVAACMVAGVFLLSDYDMERLGVRAAATMLFVSNVAYFRTTDYFADSADFDPLLHTWSLAVEEQFYIIFPLFLAFLWRFFRKRLSTVLLGLLLISLAVSVIAGQVSPAFGFYLPFSRAYELLAGAVVAAKPKIFTDLSQGQRDWLSVAGLALITASLFLIDEERFAFPGFIALLPVLGTALVLGAGHSGETVCGRVLSGRPIQVIGNLSYSLYLWHWPILVFARHFVGGELSPALSMALAVVAIGVSWCSYHFIELPFVRGLSRLPTLSLGSGAIASLTAAAVTVVLTNGVEQRFSAQSLAISAARTDYNPRRSTCHFNSKEVRPYETTCTFGGATIDVAVWGDSHGAELAVALGQVLERSGRGVREITTSSCPPALGYKSNNAPLCTDQNAVSIDGILSDPNIETVIMVAAWESYGARKAPSIAAGLEEAARRLAAAQKAVIIIEPIPNQTYDPPSGLSIRADDKTALLSWGRALNEVQRDLRPLRSIVIGIAERVGAKTFDPLPLLCGDSLCPGYDPTLGVLYFNQTHLSLTGARKLAEHIPL